MVKKNDHTPDDDLAEFRFDTPDDGWMELVRNSESPIPLDSIGPYELIEEVGRGGQGVVYRARIAGQDRQVALKRLLAGSFASASMRRRFEREIDALASLDHPNIVRIDAVDYVDSLPFLCTDWIEGAPIGRHVKSPASDLPGSVGLMIKVCEAVQHAHLHGILHRDLKPSNILVDSNGEPHLLDFGLAKPISSATNSDSAPLTSTGGFVGTLAYSAPERLAARPDEIDVRSDVYSLGVILYSLVCDRLPYESEPDLGMTIRAIQESDPKPPSSYNPAIPRSLDGIILTALSKEKPKRYPSVDALAEDLRRFLRGHSVSANLPGAFSGLAWTWRRHRVGICFALLLLISSFTVSVIVLLYNFRLAQERDAAVASKSLEIIARKRADADARRALAVTTFLKETLAAADPRIAGTEATVREVLDRAAFRIEEDLSKTPETEASIRLVIGSSYHALSELDEAKDHFVRALELRRQTHDEHGLEVAEALDELGHLLTSRGDYDGARRHLEQALKTRRTLLDPHDLKVATSLSHLAKVVYLRRDYLLAEDLYRECYEIRLHELGSENETVATSLCNLASALHSLGRVEECEDLYRESLRVMRLALGPRHIDVADILANLGSLMKNKRELDEAESLEEEALSIRREVLSPEHPLIAYSLVGLANVRSWRGDHRKAERLLREALDLRREALGEDHELIGTTLLLLADSLKISGKPAAARRTYLEALEQMQRTRSGRHPSIAFLKGRLAKLDQDRGDLDKAEDGFREALEILQDQEGSGDAPNIARAMKQLGCLLAHKEEHLEAISLHREALAIHKKTFGANHPVTAEIAADLALSLHRSGDADAAIALHRQALAGYRNSPGDNRIQIATSLNRMALILGDREQADRVEAESLFCESLALTKESYGPSHPKTLVLLNNLALCVASLDRVPEAVEILEKVTVLGDQTLPRWDLELSAFHGNLGRQLLKLNRFSDAEKHLKQSLAILERIRPEPSQTEGIRRSLEDCCSRRRNQTREPTPEDQKIPELKE